MSVPNSSRSSHSSPPAASLVPPAPPAPSLHLPPLHGVTVPSSDAIPMTAPFAVPYPVAESDSATATAGSASQPTVRSPSDGMAAKMVAGGLSCMIISALLNPMDVVKIKLQTQNQLGTTAALARVPSPVSPTITKPLSVQSTIAAHSAYSTQSSSPLHLSMYADSKYKGMTNGLLTIYREEGYARGLMRGVTPSLLREASYSSIRMGLYDYFRGVIAPPGTRKEDFTLFHKIAAGVCSGALGSSLATPLDLMKIRFQSYSLSNPNPFRNTPHAFLETVRSSGMAGLYKGVGPTTVRAAILNSSSLASYDHSKAWLIRTGRSTDGLATHLFASIVSGLVTTTVVNPFDVVKTRIMTDGTNAAEGGQRRYRHAIDCAVQTWRAEGARAFSKGWLPNYLRLGPHFILSLPLAEFIRVQLGADTY